MKKKKPKDEKSEFSKKLALIEESLSRFQHVVPIETVIPYQSNPRDNSAAVDKVAESLLECGWCNSIAVESLKNPVIAAGHTRLQAALKIGLKRVPVQPLDHLPPEKIPVLLGGGGSIAARQNLPARPAYLDLRRRDRRGDGCEGDRRQPGRFMDHRPAV